MYMVAGIELGSHSGVGADIELDWERFEVVEEFIYLGMLVSRESND